MRIRVQIVAVCFLLGLGLFSSASAADKKHLGGPKGGRYLEKTQPKAEFFVEKDRTVSIHFYDGSENPIAAGEQVVRVIADAPSGKQTLEFEKKGNTLVSKTKLPEGDGYQLVVQYKESTGAKPQNFRFKLETHTCGGCDRAEYACTCDE